MAYAVQLTIGTGNKVSINYQSQEVSLSLTYQLEREDADVLAVARDKAGEVAAAHRIAWERIRDEKVSQKKEPERKENEAEPKEAVFETSQNSSESATEVEATPEVEEKSSASSVPVVPLTGGQLAAIEALLVQAGWTQSQLEDHLLNQFGKSEVVELSAAEAAQMLLQLQRDERLKTQSRSQERRSHSARLNGHS